jgi:hypothetical protein
MLIEYKIRLGKDGVTVTQRVEPGCSTNHMEAGSSDGEPFSRRLGHKFEAGKGGGGPEEPPGSGGGGPEEQPGAGGGGPEEQPGSGGGGPEEQPRSGGGGPEEQPGSGSGGPEEQPGSGGGGPEGQVIVFGPIVICGSNQRMGQPKGETDPDVPLISEVLTGNLGKNMPFQMDRQEETQWCWAAVSVSVDRYFADTSMNLTQCRLAENVLGPGSCSHPENFNEPRRLQEGLRIVGNLREPPLRNPVSFKTIQREIAANRPVCARIAWDGGGAHFVVIDGCTAFKSGFQQLHVADPDAGPSVVSYNELVSGYRYRGEWTDTFFLRA